MAEWIFSEQKDREHFIANGMPATVKINHEIARMITNGTKHFKNKIKTRTQAGFSSAFSYAFARPLMVEKDDGSEISADELLESLVSFWKDQQANGLF